jgi:hypothetical protein
MKIIPTRYSFTFAFACMAIFVTTIPKVWGSESEDFVLKLKTHYQSTQDINAFSITHNYLYLGQYGYYRSWDYQAPYRYTAFKVTEFDLEKKYYFENVIHHYTGGRKMDEVHFQNDTESFRYEKNGIPYGKQIVRQSLDDYDEFKNIIMINVDFFAVRPLLEEKIIEENINIYHEKRSGKTTLIHKYDNDRTIEYVFSDSPLRLISINNKLMRRIYFYDDYQTVNGLTFAQSIVQYTNGDMTPTFIKRIERIDILEEIEPKKLRVPEGFSPVIIKSDRTLVSEKIAKDLYLVTDSSAWRNSLFKVNGDEVMIFGAPSNLERAEQTIKLILGLFPKKTITSVYVTHPHRDHISSLSVYAKLGITIRADAYTIAAIKAYIPFADNISNFKFTTIKHNQVIDDVHFYVLENTHSKRQSFAYFKDIEIIYQADFFEVPFDNSIAKELPSYTKTFIDFVRSKQLKFSRMVSHHYNNNISPKIMDKAYVTHIM